MARTPSSFKKDDVRRAIAAAEEAGQIVNSMEIDPNGTIKLRFGEVPDSDEAASGWDKAIEKKKAS